MRRKEYLRTRIKLSIRMLKKLKMARTIKRMHSLRKRRR
jgi:hypothetical protein